MITWNKERLHHLWNVLPGLVSFRGKRAVVLQLAAAVKLLWAAPRWTCMGDRLDAIALLSPLTLSCSSKSNGVEWTNWLAWCTKCSWDLGGVRISSSANLYPQQPFSAQDRSRSLRRSMRQDLSDAAQQVMDWQITLCVSSNLIRAAHRSVGWENPETLQVGKSTDKWRQQVVTNHNLSIYTP